MTNEISMDERIRPTKSGLFMIELLIAVGVFTFCAAVSVGVFVRAEVMSRESADLTRAVTEARSVVECWKATGGSLERTAALCGGRVSDGALVIGYDSDWQPAGTQTAHRLLLTASPAENYAGGTVVVERQGKEEPLLRWEVAALEAEP